METQQSQYMARIECQRFVSGHMLCVTGATRKFMRVPPSHTGIPKMLCVRAGHTQKLRIPVCEGGHTQETL